jgi:hypothetical protein
MLSMMLISTYVYEPIIAYTSCIFMRYICFHTTLHLIRLIDARTHTHRQRHMGKRQKPSTSLWGYLRLDRLACVMKPDVSTCLIGNDRHLPMHAHPNFEPIFCIPSLLYDKDIIICISIYIYSQVCWASQCPATYRIILFHIIFAISYKTCLYYSML